MNAKFGWGLTLLATALGYHFYGWRGVALAASGMVFWLLLQFSRAMRVMRTAGQSPVGIVPSAVMLNAKLNVGMRLMDIIMLTRSLGEKLAPEPETWCWRDSAGHSVQVVLRDGRCSHWSLTRSADAEPTPAGPEAGSEPPASASP